MELPSYTEAGLRETVYKERYTSLGDYLKGFRYTVGVMQSAEALERIAAELAEDNQAEGVRYLEVRFAPQLHVRPGLDAIQVLAAVDRGLRRARDAYNRRPEIAEGREPPFEYGIICCALRMFGAGFSCHYDTLLAAHPFTRPKDVYAMASLDAARAAVLARDTLGLQVVGFDLAGEEAGYPASAHKEAFELAHKHFLKRTVHAGEAYGPESIFQAITDLHADRIGHGTYLLEADQIRDPEIEDRDRYVEKLGNYIADRRITLEICLTSNLQTNPEMKTLRPAHVPQAARRAHLDHALHRQPPDEQHDGDQRADARRRAPRPRPARPQVHHHLRLQAQLLAGRLPQQAPVRAPGHRPLRRRRATARRMSEPGSRR